MGVLSHYFFLLHIILSNIIKSSQEAEYFSWVPKKQAFVPEAQ